jgi:hypothetical protein
MTKVIIGMFCGAGYISPDELDNGTSLVDVGFGLIYAAIPFEEQIKHASLRVYSDYHHYTGGIEEPADKLFATIQEAYSERKADEKIQIVLFGFAQGCLSAMRVIQKLNADKGMQQAVEVFCDFRNPSRENINTASLAPEMRPFSDLTHCDIVREANIMLTTNAALPVDHPQFHPSTNVLIDVLPGAPDIQQSLSYNNQRISAETPTIQDASGQPIRDKDTFAIGFLKSLQLLKRVNVELDNNKIPMLAGVNINDITALQERQLELYSKILMKEQQRQQPSLQSQATSAETIALNARHAILMRDPLANTLLTLKTQDNTEEADVNREYKPITTNVLRLDPKIYQQALSTLCQNYLRHLISKLPKATLSQKDHNDRRSANEVELVDHDGRTTYLDCNDLKESDFTKQQYNYEKIRLVLEILYLVNQKRFHEACERAISPAFKNIILAHGGFFKSRMGNSGSEANQFYSDLMNEFARIRPASTSTEAERQQLMTDCKNYLSHLIEKLPVTTLRDCEAKQSDGLYTIACKDKEGKLLFPVDVLSLDESHFSGAQQFNFKKLQSVIVILNCIEHREWGDFCEKVKSPAFKDQMSAHGSLLKFGSSVSSVFYTTLLKQAEKMQPAIISSPKTLRQSEKPKGQGAS